MREFNLDALLARTAEEFAYPPTPDVRARVLAKVASRQPASRGTQFRWYAIAATAIIVAVLASVLAIPSTRSAVAGFFGVRGSEIVPLPTPAPGTTPTPFPTPQGIEQIAQPITLADGGTALGFPPPLPKGEGAPEHVYLLHFSETVPVVVLGYGHYDLWVLRPDEGGIFQKGEAGLTIDQPQVGGRPANWLSNGSHIVTYTDAQGHPAAGSQRTVTRNTLVWRTAVAFYRLETDLDEQAAIAVAETLP